jgi:hypothetical protein
VGPGIEFPNLRTPDVGRGRDPSEAVVGSEVSSGDAVVPMMESAEVRNRHDTLLGRRLERAWVRAVLVQRLMGARGIVVGQVSPQQPKEVSLVQDQEVVEALSPDRSDDPLDEGILPGCAWGDEHLTNPHPLDSPRELSAIDAIAITEQVRRAASAGNASTICRAVQAAVGWSVMLMWMSSRRWCRRTTKTKSRRKVRVGTRKKSIAAMSRA